MPVPPGHGEPRPALLPPDGAPTHPSAVRDAVSAGLLLVSALVRAESVVLFLVPNQISEVFEETNMLEQITQLFLVELNRCYSFKDGSQWRVTYLRARQCNTRANSLLDIYVHGHTQY